MKRIKAVVESLTETLTLSIRSENKVKGRSFTQIKFLLFLIEDHLFLELHLHIVIMHIQGRPTKLNQLKDNSKNNKNNRIHFLG